MLTLHVVPKDQLEFFCLECGRKDSLESFGPFIRCPLCNSSDVLNYRLWRRHGAKTPPPRKGNLTLGDFNSEEKLRKEELREKDADEKAGKKIPFTPNESAG